MKKNIFLLFVLLLNFAKAQVVPTYETFTLKNGLKVYLLQYGKIPAVNVKLVLNTGKVNEAPGQQNYSDLVSNAILMGNAKYDVEAQSNKAFALGSTINSSVTNDNTIIQMDILSKNLDEGLDVISAAILTPTFPKEKTDIFISQNIDFNSPAKMDIGQLAEVFSNNFIYGSLNPLGRYFYKEQLQKVTPQIIKEYYDFNFTPKNANLIICGSFDQSTIKATIEKYFGNWKSTYGTPSSVSLESPSIKKKELAFVNRNGATQCALQWSKTAPAINDKDALAFMVANDLFNVFLFQEIREKGGKTYSIGSSYKPSKFSNLFSVACSVRNNELYNTIELFDKTLAVFNANAISEENFKASVNKMIVNLNRIETPSEVSSFYNPLIYNFEKRKNRVNDLKSLTLEDVRKAIKKYFTPNIYKLVIAGDESKIAAQLEKIKDYRKMSALDIEKDN